MVSPSPECTERWGAQFAQLLQAGDVIALTAPLGGGKTTLVRGLAMGLGIDESEVSSPTFVIWQIYSGRLKLHHLDTYRLSSLEELEDLGISEILGVSDVVVLEWAGLAAPLLPEDRVEIFLDYIDSDPDQRQLRVVGYGHWQQRLEGWSANG